MSMRFLLALSAIAFFASWSLLAQDRRELTSNPRFITNAPPSQLVKLTPESLRKSIVILSSRNNAYVGYNDPEIQVALPKSDNSIYATMEFSEPEVVDKKGRKVKYALERGILDFETYSDEIRLRNLSSQTGTVDFEHAVGTVRIIYPLSLRTIEVKRGKKSTNPAVRFDGPFVIYDQAMIAVPSPASFSKIVPVRAFDQKGRQLQKHDSESFESDGEHDYRTVAFWGEVASVKLDLVDAWSTLDVSYDAFPSPKLPAGREGTARPAPVALAGNRVKISILEEFASEGSAEAVGGVAERLERAGYREANAESFVMSAIRDDVETVKLFLEAGLDVDAKDPTDNVTALHRAASFGNWPVARMLLSKGADPDAKDGNGSSALLQAASHCEAVDVVRSMLKAGADVNAKARGGATPLMMAQVSKCSEIEAMLKKKGAK